MSSPPATTDIELLLRFMFRLGQAYLASGEQTAVVERYLRRIALANGMQSSRVVTFPTAVIIALHDGAQEHVTMAEGPTRTLRLDQIAEVYKLGSMARRGAIDPRAGLKQLDDVLAMPPRFGSAGVVLGHAILTLGLAIVQLPTLANVTAAAILGFVVGSLKVANRNQPVLAAPLSVVSAAVVSILVFLAVERGWPVDPRYALVPPLVSFLPGAMLAFALVELTYGDMVSGSSRLMTGVIQLFLLAFGLATGALLVGYTPKHLLDGPVQVTTPLWATLGGVALFGLGAYLHHSAPRRSLRWMLLVLFAAFAAQRAAAPLVGAEISGFFGMLAATPLGNLIQNRFKGPPSVVTFLPSFWLLVPGVLGLFSVKQMLVAQSGTPGVASVVLAFTSIALGTLVGESLTNVLDGSLGWTKSRLARLSRGSGGKRGN